MATTYEKTPPRQDPQGQKINITGALATYGKLHSTMLEYVMKTSDDLRAHVVGPVPFTEGAGSVLAVARLILWCLDHPTICT